MPAASKATWRSSVVLRASDVMARSRFLSGRRPMQMAKIFDDPRQNLYMFFFDGERHLDQAHGGLVILVAVLRNFAVGIDGKAFSNEILRKSTAKHRLFRRLGVRLQQGRIGVHRPVYFGSLEVESHIDFSM